MAASPRHDTLLWARDGMQAQAMASERRNARYLGAVSLPALLREAAVKSQGPATSSMLFDGYLQPYVKNWGLPDLLLSSRKLSESRLAVAFGESPDRFELNDADDP